MLALSVFINLGLLVYFKYSNFFIENTYDHFKGIERHADHSDPEFQKKVNDLRNYIKSDKEWMKHIEQKATENQVSVDSMITLDAIWQVRQQN